MNTPLVTVVIATFNSARTLALALDAIRKQTYPQNRREILVVDGGSNDATREIAKAFDCRIIDNPNVEPLYAKYLGYIHAKGTYITYIDHDEVLANPDSIKRKVEVLKKNPYIKAAVAAGYRTPPGYHAINRYINEFGDPFSFFMYRLSKNADFFVSTMRRRYPIASDTKDTIVFDLSGSAPTPLIELAAGGGMIDGRFFKKKFPEIIKQYHLIPHMLHLLRPANPLLAVVKDDILLHYSDDLLASYVNKLNWRIKNNIFFTTTIGASGFWGRQGYQTGYMRNKKFLFLPYAFSLIFPSLDALFLIVTRRDAAYLVHVPLTLITAVLITYHFVLKVFGKRPVLKSYDGSTVAYEKN